MKKLPLNTLVPFLDKELGLAEFPRDESANGLQVEGAGTVRRIGLAVDACEYVFREAAALQVDFLVVHHGLIWGDVRAVTGLLRDRIRLLLDNDISLYACHLPLDWHPRYGNNAELLRLLGIRRTGEFGEYHGRRIGCRGRLKKKTSLDSFVGRVDNLLGTRALSVDFGAAVENIGVVSGGGWSALYDAESSGIDTFLTGGPSHSAYTLAEELKVNLVFAGHYATETLGVRAVGRMLSEKFGLESIFIDHPTGL